MAQSTSDNGLTMAVIGCGTMGIAILSGIMDSLTELDSPSSSSSSSDLPPRLPTKFKAGVKRQSSADKVRKELSSYSAPLEVFEDNNLSVVKDADIVLLACKPWLAEPILKADGMADALKGKLLLSICAGLKDETLASYFSSSSSVQPAQIIRVMPNTAAKVRESMTVITYPPSTPTTTIQLVDWIFTRIGRISHIQPTQMDAATALCGSGPAFCALVLEALADGAVAMGIPRAEAQVMAAQTMRGTTGLVQQGGEHPAVLRDKVSTPGGCTIGGLLVLEEGAVRGSVSRAIREAAVVARELGEGVKGANGTRR